MNQMTELCYWRWLPGHELTHVWAYDPEPLLIRGGGGVIVCEWQEVRRPKGRSGERLMILRKNAAGLISLKGSDGFRVYSDADLREIVNECESEVVFTSNVELTGLSLRERIGGSGAVRMVDGGRVGREGDAVEFSDGPGRPMRESVGSWHVMSGNEGRVRYAIDGYSSGTAFGEVAVRDIDWQWSRIEPGSDGRYLLALFDDVQFLSFEQIVKGV